LIVGTLDDVRQRVIAAAREFLAPRAVAST
jgi:hypothetical protein